jgi:hypothetical protein
VTTNIVQEHRRKNRAPRAPRPDKLLQFNSAAGPSNGVATPAQPTAPPRTSSETASTPASGGRQARNTVNPPTDENAQPTMLRYYSPEWQAVLRKAKATYRGWLVSENAYPSMKAGKNEAVEAIEEAIAEFEMEGGVLDYDGALKIIGLNSF